MLDDLVFVGGCTTGLFLTDSVAGGIRPTTDVDAIVDVTSYAEYASLADRLRALGLAEDATPGAPLCRWRRDAIIVDVMPIDASVLGASDVRSLLDNPAFAGALSGFLLPDAASQGRRGLVEERLRALSESGNR